MLLFPQWKMTPDEILDEISKREKIFKESGETGVQARLIELVIEALEDPERDLGHKNASYEILRSFDPERAAPYREEIDQSHAEFVRNLKRETLR